jgi:hypothetical protein
LSTGLSGVGFSQGALGILFSNFFLFSDGFDLAVLGSSLDADDLRGELESLDVDDLSGNVIAIDEDSVGADNVDNSDELAFMRTVSDSGDATNLHESVISLNSQVCTIAYVW